MAALAPRRYPRPVIGAYRTLATRVEHQPALVKGSRFLGLAAPVADEAAAAALVAEARRRWPDATHHCWAWRLADGTARSSDDGEPGGSAGRPILAQIEGHGLHGVVAGARLEDRLLPVRAGRDALLLDPSQEAVHGGVGPLLTTERRRVVPRCVAGGATEEEAAQ